MDLGGVSASRIAKVFVHLHNSGLLEPKGLTGGLVAIDGTVENTVYENNL